MSHRVRRLILIPLVTVVVAGGCTVVGQPSATGSASTAGASAAARSDGPSSSPITATPTATLPVDPSLSPVSRTSPAAEALIALDASGWGDRMAEVAGMALVPSGIVARVYAPLSGNEPELMTTDPVWMIQLRGRLVDPFTDETSIDPVCVVVDGQAGIYSTGDVILADGSVHTPRPVPSPPRVSLPPLSP